MSHVKILPAFTAILVSVALVQGCGKQGEDEKRAEAMADEKLYPQVVGEVLTDAQREKLEVSSGLILKPCTIELVDGRTVTGQLAVQFDMPDRYIVYSPRLATVRSFLKDHMHALTVEGKRKVLNAKRELTDEEAKLLGRVEWPDEPPAEGSKPAYTTETWEKPEQLLVWARPGRSGRVEDAGNWLVNGRPVSQLPKDSVGVFQPAGGKVDWSTEGAVEGTDVLFGRKADLLFPASAREYNARVEPIFSARHITTENNARFHGRNTPGVWGNVWITAGGEHRVSHGYFPAGPRHTFFFNDKPGLDWGQGEDDGIRRRVARYIQINKDDGVSVEFLGATSTTDEFHIHRGVMILGEDAQMLIGNRTTQSVREGAVLQLQSGSFFGKHTNMGGSCMVVMGTLRAGSPDRPITRDCYIGVGYNDREGHIRAMKAESGHLSGPWLGWRAQPGGDPGRTDWYDFFSLTTMPTSRVRVHSADPSKARLVIKWHERDGWGGAGAGRGDDPVTPEQQKFFEEHLHGRISAIFAGDVQFDGVLFDNFHKGGIVLCDADMRRRWKNVYFGPDNEASPDDLFAAMPQTLTLGFVRGGFRGALWDYGDNEIIPLIDPPAGRYAKGTKVEARVIVPPQTERWPNPLEGGRLVESPTERLPDGRELRIHYTVDHAIVLADSPRYMGEPITIRDSRTLKVRAFGADGVRLGREARAPYRFESMSIRAADDPEATKPGLKYAYYHSDRGDLAERTPEATGVVEVPTLSVRTRGHEDAVVFSGYVAIDEPGLWTFYLTSDYTSRLYIGDELVVDNSERGPRQHWKVMTRAGQAKLTAGHHTIRIEARDCREVFETAWRGPGRDRQPIPAAALSHAVAVNLDDPFPLRPPWGEWAVRRGDDPISRKGYKHRFLDWRELAEVTGMTEEQRAQAERLFARFAEYEAARRRDTGPALDALRKMAKDAGEAGDTARAKELEKLTAVEIEQKLWVFQNRGAELLKLLTPEQLRKFTETNSTRLAVAGIARMIAPTDRDTNRRLIEGTVELSEEQEEALLELVRAVVRSEYLPKIDPMEDGATRPTGRHREMWPALANSTMPLVIEKILTDEQRALLASAEAADPAAGEDK